MTSILDIQPRQQDLRTQTNEDWLDGFPLYRAGPAGTLAGPENAGNGSLTINSVEPLTMLGGYRVEVTGVSNLTAISVTSPTGVVLATGFAGVPLYAGGITLTLNPGSTPFRSGDSFAVQPTIGLIDDTGIDYVLQVRRAQGAAAVVFQAESNPPSGVMPTIAAGGGTGRPALVVPHTQMHENNFPAGIYVYDLLAIADGRRKVVYYGNLNHVQGAGYIP